MKIYRYTHGLYVVVLCNSYVVIVHPMRARSWCTISNTYKMIAAVWAASLLLSAPTLHIMVCA